MPKKNDFNFAADTVRKWYSCLPSGCLSLNCINTQAVNNPKAPKNTITIMPGTNPTTAKELGRESMPLLTISAIISTATRGHDNVLYWIWWSSSCPKTSTA